jgi:uncharacterized damage-inducible protein DinB
MTEDKDALLAHYRRVRADLVAAIEGIPDESMVERSLDGWSVMDHLLHLSLWDDLRASEVQRISAGFESAWRMSDEQDEAYNAMGHELRRDLSLGQARWEFAGSHQRLLDAIAAATPRGLDASLYGEAGLVRGGHDEEHAGWIKRWRGEKGI